MCSKWQGPGPFQSEEHGLVVGGCRLASFHHSVLSYFPPTSPLLFLLSMFYFLSVPSSRFVLSFLLFLPVILPVRSGHADRPVHATNTVHPALPVPLSALSSLLAMPSPSSSAVPIPCRPHPPASRCVIRWKSAVCTVRYQRSDDINAGQLLELVIYRGRP